MADYKCRGCVAWILSPLCTALAASALAADGNISVDKSSLVATFLQQSAAIDAAFKHFEGTILYDPARPLATRATLSIDMDSLDVGDEDTNAEVRKPAWFDSVHFPRASFRSTLVKPGDAGHFDATGELSIKGRTRLITVSVNVQRAARTYAYDGSFELSRRDFGIGDASWDAVLDDKVHVRFHLLAPGN